MEGIKVVATNRKATHDYTIEDRYEAGLVLMGTEIKSIREGRVNIREGYVQERDGELWMINVHVAPYDQAGRHGHDPLRPRKLLLHRKEINRLLGSIRERGYTLIVLRIYLKNGRAKAEIALARGKRKYDKREAISKREAEREMRRDWKSKWQ